MSGESGESGGGDSEEGEGCEDDGCEYSEPEDRGALVACGKGTVIGESFDAKESLVWSPNDSNRFDERLDEGTIKAWDGRSLEYRSVSNLGDSPGCGDDACTRVLGERADGDSSNGVRRLDKSNESSSLRCPIVPHAGKNHNRTDLGRIVVACTSVFVGNLSPGPYFFRLKSIFSAFGEVCGIFISQKVSRIDASRFAFVRFRHKADALKAIGNLNGAVIDGNPLVVNIARFDRNRLEDSAGSKWPDLKMPLECNLTYLGTHFTSVKEGAGVGDCTVIPKGVSVSYLKPGSSSFWPGSGNKASFAQAVIGALSNPNHNIGVSKKIMGSRICTDWLDRSAIAYVKNISIMSRISDLILREFKEVCSVRIWGFKQLVIEFKSVGLRDELLGLGLWSDLFDHIKPWDGDLNGSERPTWIECSGIPIHSWSISTFSDIAKIWGSFLCVDEGTRVQRNLCKAFIFITTKEKLIEGSIELVVNKRSFIVNIAEVVSPESGGNESDMIIGKSQALSNNLGLVTTSVLGLDSVVDAGVKVGLAVMINGISQPKELEPARWSMDSAAVKPDHFPLPEGVSRSVCHKSGVIGSSVSDRYAQAEAIFLKFEGSSCAHRTSFYADIEGNFLLQPAVKASVDSFLRSKVSPADGNPAFVCMDSICGFNNDGLQKFREVIDFQEEHNWGAAVSRRNAILVEEAHHQFGNEVLSDLFGVHEVVSEAAKGLDGDVYSEGLEGGCGCKDKDTAPSVDGANGNNGFEQYLVSKGRCIISKDNIEAMTNGLIGGISEAFELGESVGIYIPLEVQSLIKAVMEKRQVIIMKALYDNG